LLHYIYFEMWNFFYRHLYYQLCMNFTFVLMSTVICHTKHCVFCINHFRTVCDRDLTALANNCKKLEQLDILGTREVTVKDAQKYKLSSYFCCLVNVKKVFIPIYTIWSAMSKTNLQRPLTHTHTEYKTHVFFLLISN